MSTSSHAPVAIRSAASVGTASAQMKTGCVLRVERSDINEVFMVTDTESRLNSGHVWECQHNLRILFMFFFFSRTQKTLRYISLSHRRIFRG